MFWRKNAKELKEKDKEIERLEALIEDRSQTEMMEERSAVYERRDMKVRLSYLIDANEQLHRKLKNINLSAAECAVEYINGSKDRKDTLEARSFLTEFYIHQKGCIDITREPENGS